MRHKHWENPRDAQVSEHMVKSLAQRTADAFRHGSIERLDAERDLRALGCFEAEITAYLGRGVQSA